MSKLKTYGKNIAAGIVIFLLFAVFAYAEEDTDSKEQIQLRDIDFAPAAEMYIDTSQIIEVNPIPVDASISKISFRSSDTSVITVNEIGRIRAVGTGSATVYVTADGITRSSDITVKSSKIFINDLDIGPYEKKLETGQSLLIQVTPIPINATEGEIKFRSSDSKIATVNQAGRVTGIAPGDVRITVACGGISKTVDITIIEEKVVTEIDVLDYQKKMKVKEKQNLSIVLYPEDAREKNVKFSSSDPYIATVSSSGQIAALHMGTTVISISCGKAKTEMELTVREITKSIDVNSTYITMKPGEKFRLTAVAQPNSANQSMTYKPTNSKIITVDDEGLIMAKKIGSSSVIISNEDMYQVVFIAVNKNNGDKYFETKNSYIGTDGKSSTLDKTKLLSTYKEEGDGITLPAESFDIIDKDFLTYLRNNEEKIKIDYPEYFVEIDSADINNPNYEFIPKLTIRKEAESVFLIVNNGNKLPGKIKIYLKDSLQNMKYLYFENDSTNKKEKIAFNIKEHSFKIDDGGTYILTEKKLSEIKIERKVVIAAGLIFAVIVLFFVLIRKKYWFW